MKSVYHVYDPLYTMYMVQTPPKGGLISFLTKYFFMIFIPPSGGALTGIKLAGLGHKKKLTLFRSALISYNFFLFNFFYYRFKSFRVVHCKIGQSFSVKTDSLFCNFSYEFRITHIILTYSSINPLYPKGSELAFLFPSVAVGIP